MILKMSMIFTGQGTQNIHNLLNLNYYDNIIKNTFEEASEYLNYNIWNSLKKPYYILKKDYYIQTIIITSAVAIYKFWKKIGGKNPDIASGHSLGEYAALICSNAIKFSDGILLIKKREIIMRQKIEYSKIQMQAIIGLKKNIISKICKKNTYNKIVNIANINSKKQIIISGYKESVQKISLKCKKLGAKIVTLPITVAAHCNIMKNKKKKFLKHIKKIHIKKMDYPILNSISVKKQHNKKTIINNLIKQLFQPVQWEKTMNLIKSTSDIILEVSTNNILTKLHKKHNYINIIPINNLKNINYILNTMYKL